VFKPGGGDELTIGYVCKAGFWFSHSDLAKACEALAEPIDVDDCAAALIITVWMLSPFDSSPTSGNEWSWFVDPDADLANLPHVRQVFDDHISRRLLGNPYRVDLCGLRSGSNAVDPISGIGARDSDFSETGGAVTLICVDRTTFRVSNHVTAVVSIGGGVKTHDEIRVHIQPSLQPVPDCEHRERD
jgi:hypothetical protein